MIHYFINTLKCLIDNIYMQILNDTDYQPSLEEKRVTTLNRRLDETGSEVVREREQCYLSVPLIQRYDTCEVQFKDVKRSFKQLNRAKVSLLKHK